MIEYYVRITALGLGNLFDMSLEESSATGLKQAVTGSVLFTSRPVAAALVKRRYVFNFRMHIVLMYMGEVCSRRDL